MITHSMLTIFYFAGSLLASQANVCDVTAFNGNPNLCLTVTSACLNSINLSALPPDCIYNIPFTRYRHLGPKAYKELTEHANLSMAKKAILTEYIFRLNDWGKNPAEGFIQRILADPTERMATAKAIKREPKSLARLFTEKTRNLSRGICSELTHTAVPHLSPGFIRAMHPDCIKNLPPIAYQGFTSAQIPLLPVEFFRTLTMERAQNLRVGELKTMTPLQAANFAPEVQIPANADKATIAQIFSNHPCKYAQLIDMQLLDNPQASKALRRRCPVDYNQ